MVKRIFEKFKRSFGTDEPDIDEVEDEYVELDVLGGSEDKKGTAKVIVRPFVINDFSDIIPDDSLYKLSVIILTGVEK